MAMKEPCCTYKHRKGICGSSDNAVGLVTKLLAGRFGFRFPAAKTFGVFNQKTTV